MTITTPGRFFTAESSRSYPATLSRDAAGLLLTVQGWPEPLRPRLVERSATLAGLPTTLTFADRSVFETISDPTLFAILQEKPGFFEWVDGHERSVTSVIAAALITIALSVGLWLWGIPALASVAARLTPSTVSETIDAGMLATLNKTVLRPSTLSEEQKALTRADFEALAAASGTTTGRLTLYFFNAPGIGANAFALPGGSIVLTDQLVRLSRHPDEIAGVLAHEIGHVAHRHSLRSIYAAVGLNIFVTLVSGDPGSAIDGVIQQGVTLQSLSYTRAFERDADRNSVALMQKLKRDPLAMIALLDRIVPRQEQGETSFLSTHPGLDERRREVEKLVRASTSR
jgi:Zn-dependent protease with chaperone function